MELERDDSKWAGDTLPYMPGIDDLGGNGAYCSLQLGGRYLIGRLVGSGGTSQVYEALQLNLRRGVAIKVLHPTLADDPELAATFHREALLASQFEHRNIVRVIDCCTDNIVGPYIVTELLTGPTLAEQIRSESSFALHRVLERIRQVLDGLGCAHAAGVVHADLKPANVMVETDADGAEVLKLVDFGSAVSGKGLPALTDLFYGTPSYIAPEVIGGASPDVAADIYAAGIVLFELVTGELPFVAPSLEELLAEHLDKAPPSVGDFPRVRELGVDPEVVGELDSIIGRALAKDVAGRFQDAAAFRSALERLSNQALADETSERVEQQRQAALGLLERIEILQRAPDEDGQAAAAAASRLWLALGHVRQAMGERHNALVAAFRALQLGIRIRSRELEARSDALIAELIGEAPVSASVARLRRYPVTIAPRRGRRARVARSTSARHQRTDRVASRHPSVAAP